MAHIVSGQYDTHGAAIQAVWDIHSAGLPLGDIALLSLNMQPASAPARSVLPQDAVPFEPQAWWEGFLEAVMSRQLGADALREYTEVIRSGVYLILVHGAASQMGACRRVLEDSGARGVHVQVTAEKDRFGPPDLSLSLNPPPARAPERRWHP